MVYVLIPAHNNKPEVLELLSKLEDQTWQEFKIVLVDDGSTDGTMEEVGRNFPTVIIINGTGDLWWTGANVKGVEYILGIAATDDFILLLNNDLVVRPDYVEILVNAGIKFGTALIGSTTVDYADHDIVEAGIRLTPGLNLIVNRDSAIIRDNEFDIGVDVLPGRGTLIPVKVFNKIGNFNLTKLPHYGADYEFSIRARRAGFNLVIAHSANVYAKLDITGLEVPTQRSISVRECYDLLFSKKSKTNIYYYFNYVWLCSDKVHRLPNSIRSILGTLLNTIGRISFLFPFFELSSRLANHVGRFSDKILTPTDSRQSPSQKD